MKHMTITGMTFTRDASSSSTAAAGGQAIHRILLPFPVAYFTAAFATDLAYWRTAEVMWERFSIWLIVAGLVMAGFAVIAAVIDLAAGAQKLAWPRASGYVLAVLLSLINAFVHSRDAYAAVVPTGLILSALVVVILLAAAPASWALTYPRHVGANT
jgi:uncharacterized membrane protein